MKCLLLITYVLYGFNKDVTTSYLDKYLSRQGKPLQILKDKNKSSTERMNALCFLVATLYSKMIASEIGLNLKAKSNSVQGIDKDDLGLLFYGDYDSEGKPDRIGAREKKAMLSQLIECMPADIMHIMTVDLAEAYPLDSMKSISDMEVGEIFQEMILQAMINCKYLQYDITDTEALIKNKTKKWIDLKDAMKDFIKNTSIMEEYKTQFLQEYAEKRKLRKENMYNTDKSTDITATNPTASDIAVKTDSKADTSANTKKRKRSDSIVKNVLTPISNIMQTKPNASNAIIEKAPEQIESERVAQQKKEKDVLVQKILREHARKRVRSGNNIPKIDVVYVAPEVKRQKPVEKQTVIYIQPAPQVKTPVDQKIKIVISQAEIDRRIREIKEKEMAEDQDYY